MDVYRKHTHQSILYQIYSWSWRSSIELCISPVSRARKKKSYYSNRKLGILDFFAINNTNHITKESLTKDTSISFFEKKIWLNIGFFSQTGQYIVIVQAEMWMKETTNKVYRLFPHALSHNFKVWTKESRSIFNNSELCQPQFESIMIAPRKS
jgi:hypothetical protein